MKFQRNAKISRAHVDAAPFAGVFFCLLIFILMASLVYTPGVRIQLPVSQTDLPGPDGPTLAVALDTNGQYYFKNQIISETNLQLRLKTEASRQTEPLTLVVQADAAVTLAQLNHLRDLAAGAGIKQLWQAVLPRPFDSPADSKKP